MEEWPDANCSIKGWGSRGGHATRFLFFARLFHPPQSRQTAGVSIEHVGEKVLVKKPTIEINRIPRSGSLFWGAFTMAVAIICQVGATL
jgi:hypothetical protein